MKTFLVCLTTFFLLTNVIANAQQKEDSLARKFITFLHQGRYNDASQMTNDAFRRQANATTLQSIWQTFEQRFGAFEKLDSSTSLKKDSFIVIFINTFFKTTSLRLQVAFDQSDRVIGFRTMRATPRTRDETATTDSSGYGVFQQEPVSLQTPTGALAGSLLLPGNSGKIPIALIIAGSGPTDRDGNSMLGEHSNAYRMLAEGLAQQGIATLRYDKRGVGASAGALQNDSDLTIENYVQDATGWLHQLKEDKRFARVIIIGHSEGSLIGMLAAKTAGADAFISIAGSGRPVDSVIMEQLRGLPAEQYTTLKSLFSKLKHGAPIDDTSLSSPALQSLFNSHIRPYMASWLKYNPAKEISTLNIPLLIINGTHDIQVPVGDARLLSQANSKASLIVIDSMNHIFKNAPADRAENFRTYRNPDLPLNSRLVPGIAAFIKKLL